MGEAETWIAAFVALIGASISVSVAGYNRDNKHGTSCESQQMEHIGSEGGNGQMMSRKKSGQKSKCF